MTLVVGEHSKDHEPGCLKYLVFVQKYTDPGCEKKIYLSQSYRDQAAFDEHLDNEPHASIMEEIAEQEMVEEEIVID